MKGNKACLIVIKC